nr:hypothetical protein [Micromonospora sp. DSM 115978]
MRHLGSLLLSALLAPVIWLLTGYGLNEYLQNRARSGELRWELALAAGALLVAGAGYALLLLPRLSPVGPVLAGLAFLAMVGWSAFDPAGLYRVGPDEILGITNPLPYPAEGYAALLAVPLLATIFSPRRWRRYDRVPALYAGQPLYHAEPAGLPPDTASYAYPPGHPAPYPTSAAGPYSADAGSPYPTGTGGPYSSGAGGPYSSGAGGPYSSGTGGPYSSGAGGPYSAAGAGRPPGPYPPAGPGHQPPRPYAGLPPDEETTTRLGPFGGTRQVPPAPALDATAPISSGDTTQFPSGETTRIAGNDTTHIPSGETTRITGTDAAPAPEGDTARLSGGQPARGPGDDTVRMAGDDTATVPTEDLSGDTRPLTGTPPPPAAYPPPGHSMPTAPPVDPTAPPVDPPEDPDSTRRLA